VGIRKVNYTVVKLYTILALSSLFLINSCNAAKRFAPTVESKLVCASYFYHVPSLNSIQPMLCSVAIYIALVRLALFNSFNSFISFTPLFAKFDIPAARPATYLAGFFSALNLPDISPAYLIIRGRNRNYSIS